MSMLITNSLLNYMVVLKQPYYSKLFPSIYKYQKQPSKGVLTKLYSENMQQITGEHPSQSVIYFKFALKSCIWNIEILA